VSILYGLSEDIRKHNTRNNVYIYAVNTSKQYNKEILNEIVQKEVIRIVDNTVYSITRNVVNIANKGYTTYKWKDDQYILDNNMYEKVIDKIMVIFPDIKMEEFDGYTIKFDWS
jgi:predicted transcriptional regulator